MNIIETSLWIEFFAGTPLNETIVNALLNIDELYTQDKHFENLDRVHYFPK